MNIEASTNVHYTITYNIDKQKLLELRTLLNYINGMIDSIEFEDDRTKLKELVRIVEQLTDYNV